jgi:hypothetical protein
VGIPNRVGAAPDGTVDACRAARRAREPPERCPRRAAPVRRLGERAVPELHERLVDEVPAAAVLVCGLESWIDAGFAAARARTTLTEPASLQPVARFDADELVDHQARRPTMHLADGMNTRLTWPAIELSVGEDRHGTRFLYLGGSEPDHRWKRFSREVAELARDAGVELVTALGAYPAPVPHTRPVKVVSTATTRELADRVGYMPGELDVPAGINAAIERACADAGIPAVGLWAQVPHYVANFPYPASALALLEALERLTGLSVDRSSLESAAADARTRLDELVAANPEHTHMVRQLETVYDDQSSTLTIPSGDELAAELERFLRNQVGYSIPPG